MCRQAALVIYNLYVDLQPRNENIPVHRGELGRWVVHVRVRYFRIRYDALVGAAFLPLHQHRALGTHRYDGDRVGEAQVFVILVGQRVARQAGVDCVIDVLHADCAGCAVVVAIQCWIRCASLFVEGHLIYGGIGKEETFIIKP